MKKKFFIGIDVSKYTLDTAFIIVENNSFSAPVWKQFANTAEGLIELKKWLHQHQIPFNEQTIIVIENTGLYHRLLWQFCCKEQLNICIENAAHVKWSLGIARGKNDKVDSRRLALYAARHQDRLKPAVELHCAILQLKDLLTLRNNLITQLGALTTYLKELEKVSDKTFMKALYADTKKAVNGLEKSIEKTEAHMQKIIRTEEKILRMHRLLCSVPGIGNITAIYLICCTNCFTLCGSGKQLACYCGVVPFDYQSGIAIKGKHHVHKMANKELKRLLHMCALSAIQHYAEFKDYYERKKKEGKHVMSVLNAIKNKLILRAFAVVKNNAPYVDNYTKAA